MKGRISERGFLDVLIAVLIFLVFLLGTMLVFGSLREFFFWAIQG